jgi:nitrogen fixation protein NifU and related proteins
MSHDLYSEFLLEHARTPQNNHAMNDATCSAHVLNEGCADSLDLYLKIENGHVQDVSFSGTLCALSTASSSLFTEFLKGKSLEELRLLTPGSVYTLLGVTIIESRTRCVLLVYQALQKSLQTCFPLQN